MWLGRNFVYFLPDMDMTNVEGFFSTIELNAEYNYHN